MIELIFIILLCCLGVFLIWLATDELINDYACAIAGIIGAGGIIYSIIWFIHWVLLGGLIQ